MRQPSNLLQARAPGSAHRQAPQRIRLRPARPQAAQAVWLLKCCMACCRSSGVMRSRPPRSTPSLACAACMRRKRCLVSVERACQSPVLCRCRQARAAAARTPAIMHATLVRPQHCNVCTHLHAQAAGLRPLQDLLYRAGAAVVEAGERPGRPLLELFLVFLPTRGCGRRPRVSCSSCGSLPAYARTPPQAAEWHEAAAAAALSPQPEPACARAAHPRGSIEGVILPKGVGGPVPALRQQHAKLDAGGAGHQAVACSLRDLHSRGAINMRGAGGRQHPEAHGSQPEHRTPSLARHAPGAPRGNAA